MNLFDNPGRNDARSHIDQAMFVCVACGHTDNADVNSARSVLQARTIAVKPPKRTLRWVGRRKHPGETLGSLALQADEHVTKLTLGMNSNVGFLAQVQYEQLSQIEEDTLISTERYTLEISLFELASFVAKAMQAHSKARVRIQGDENNAVFVVGDKICAYITKGQGSRPHDKIKSVHSVTVWGLAQSVGQVMEDLDRRYKTNKANFVQWAYTTRHGLDYKTIVVNEPHEIKQEFYPFIPEVTTYFERFMKSEAQVIVMTGPPGTGKTSLLRWALAHYRYGATITYEARLVRDDELFVDFLTSTESDFLVFEDVDLLLAPREGAENEVMSKFLNLTDGLVKFPKKKIIFSTNLTDNGRIDPALTRPGRCFDTPAFRELTYREACAAADVAGLPEPDGPCTLAQLFNRGRANTRVRRAGFVDLELRVQTRRETEPLI